MYSSTSPHPSQRSHNSSLGRQGLSKQQSGSNLQSASAATPQMSPGRTRKGSRSGSSSGNRSDGEGVSYGKDYSQPYTPAFCMSQSYLGSSSLFSSGSSASLSPFQSPARLVNNNLAAGGSKTKSLSLLADRAAAVPQAEYNGTRKHSTPNQHSVEPKVSTMPYDRDQSLDRHVDRKQQRHRNVDSHYHTISGYGRDRSSSDREREYPHMGARSLEREHQLHSAASMLRSRSSDHEYRTNPQPEMFSSSPPDSSRHTRDTLILDLQSQVAELNKECAILQQEVDGAKDKLSSTMNSIKTFWSPELKKERAIRKEENSKHCLLVEQLKMAEIENRQHLSTLVQLEQENRALRELNISTSSGSSGGGSGSHDSDIVRKEKERHAKEMKLLRKTIEEMELRIETQKQTLATRDESIKKLMDMLQSKTRQSEDERQMSDEARHIRQLEQLLEQKDNEMGKLRYDAQLQNIQKELQTTKDELSRLNEENVTSHESIETMKSQEKVLKEKLESTKIELSRKEAENGALHTQIETLQRHWEDHERHITVLRDQIGTKEEQGTMLQADLDMLRDRLKEKDETIEKKSKQLSSLMSDKKKLEEELNEVKDQLEVKNRKINSLQRKTENLEDLVKEKEAIISSTKAKLASLQADHNNSGSALSGLEELLLDKEKQIERLREQRERADRQYEEEVDILSKKSSDLKSKFEDVQSELVDRQQQEVELKEELSRLKSERLAKESLISRLELDISDKADEISQLQSQLRKLDECVSQSQVDCDRKLSTMKRELGETRHEVEAATTEVDRYVAVVKDLEKEKTDIEKQRVDLQRQVDELNQNMTELRRSQRMETNRSESTESGIRSPEIGSEEAALLKSVIADKENRIEELEEALRESIRITAQREVVMAEQQMKLEHTERVMESLQEEIGKVKKTAEENIEQLARTKRQLEEKEEALKSLQGDSKRQLSEVYEMKQEAILAAISEKDAHIALLEMAPNKKTENIEEVEKLTREKLRLQQVLKDLTQSRMKLIQNRGHLRSSSASSLLLSASNEQDDDGL